MNIYQTNEARFFVPEELQDRSLTAFVAPSPGTDDPSQPGEFSFVITRQETTEYTPPVAHVNALIEELPGSLPGFHLLERISTFVDRRPAEQIEFTWMSASQTMHQHQTCVLVGETMLTLTGTALEAVFPRYRDMLERLVFSFQFTR